MMPRSVSELLFAGRRRGSGLEVGGSLLQIGDGRTAQLIKRGFAFSLCHKVFAIFGELHFFDAFAAIGSDGQVQDWRGESRLGKLGCREIADFVDERGYGTG